MMRRAFGSWLLVAALVAQAADEAPLGVDVRLVVDVSGSMKSGDPEYLRQDVLNDLVEALPDHSRGGVWTFGGAANNVVPHGAIDDGWRRTARAARSRIVSAAPLTNLRDALASAAWDVDAAAPEWDRHVLLVTDGRIDLGRDAAQNDTQRRAIVEQWLPRLRSAGIRLDSIALSGAADLAFLAQLADATDGRAGRADSVAAVKDFIARTYGAATPRRGAFDVAEHVAELTLFATNGEALTLLTPHGDAIDATRARDDVHWRAEAGSAWVTLMQPLAGRWRFTPDTATIRTLTDLDLAAHTNGSAEAPTLRVDVLDAGQPIDPALHDVVSLDATLTTLYGTATLQVTPVDGAVAFDVALGSPLTADDSVALHLAGPTFERERTYVETITHPIDVDVRGLDDGVAGATVRVDIAAVDAKTLRVLATTTVAGGARATLGVGERQADGAWRIAVPALAKSVDVRFKVLCKDTAGRDIEINAEPLTLTLPIAKAHRYGFDADGRAIRDPVRPAPVVTPTEPAVSMPTAAPDAAVAVPVAADPPEPAAPRTRAPRLWEWLAMVAIALASVASLGWVFRRRAPVDGDAGAFDAALASYRAALAAATAKPQAATTT